MSVTFDSAKLKLRSGMMGTAGRLMGNGSEGVGTTPLPLLAAFDGSASRRPAGGCSANKSVAFLPYVP
jgi:hypothetical protein